MNENTQQATPLPALPEFEPAPDLWSRIEQSYMRRRQRRRLIAASGFATIVVAAVAMLSLSVPRHDEDLLVQQRHETEQLEQDWQALGEVAADIGYARLRPFDVALQQAYDRRADGTELGRLWSERNQMLRDLVRTHRDATVDAPDTNTLISI